MQTWIEPASDYPGLASDRLQIVASAIRQVRVEAVADHRPDAGESFWSLGCRGYERTKFAIIGLAQTYSWLTIADGLQDGPSHFVFRIASHPIRFCRSEAEQLPPRYRFPSLFDVPEFGMAEPAQSAQLVGRALRLAIDLDSEKLPSDVVLVEISVAGQSLRGYSIPTMAAAMTVTPIVPHAAPVSLPPVQAIPLSAEAPSAETGTDDE